MKDEDIQAVKDALALAEETGDYSDLNRIVRPTGTPEPGENSIRDRNVGIDELAGAQEALIAIKEEGADYADVKAAKEIVQVLRAAYREGETEAGRRPAGVSIATEDN